MAMIPMRFKRITAAWDEVAREPRLCQSSGSEHSAADNSLTDLSDLVDSFLRGDDGVDVDAVVAGVGDEGEVEYPPEEPDSSYSETKEKLMDLISAEEEYNSSGSVKCSIRAVIETALPKVSNPLPEGYKRQIMNSLRQQGFDAGLCKSRWEKTTGHPAGEYEYIDINDHISGERYIVEISLAKEFTIARPTKTYSSLLQIIPQILIVRDADLKRIVRLMCSEMRSSLKKRNMNVSPWRRNGYVQAKWFGFYKRTTNAVPSSTSKSSYLIGDMNRKRSVGFESPALAAVPRLGASHCRRDIGMHVGNLLKTGLSGML